MKKNVEVHELSCGTTLLAEHVEGVASCSMNWLLPAGSATDPADAIGVSAVLEEMIFRGAGDLEVRGLSDAMDRCGLQRHTSVGVHHLALSGVCTAHDLLEAIDLLAMIIRCPILPEEAIDPVRSLCLQELDSLQDDPRTEVMLLLRDRHQASPFNRSGHGERAALEQIDLAMVQEACRSGLVPEGSILSLAGNIDVDQVIKRFETRLGDWNGSREEPAVLAPPAAGVQHESRESNQSHIALAWSAPSASHEDARLERVATRVLSGSSSGRLFTEVRQKRSLCYSVGASYRAGRDDGTISLYAGTTPERAQETLDVCLAECARMADGVTESELQRALLGLESNVVLGGESTSARSAAMAMDWFALGRTRTLSEIIEEVRGITLDQINGYLSRRVLGTPTVVTMGPAPLDC